MLETNKIYNINCVDGIDMLDDESIDLVVTSPPYDYMRTYSGAISSWNWDVFCQIVSRLHRVMKDGGVIVWVIGDQTKNGCQKNTAG